MKKFEPNHSRKMQEPGENPTTGSRTPFTAADLPIDSAERIYHLQVKPEQIASNILLVGDPGRVDFIADNLFHSLEFKHEHRGLVTITGTAKITDEPATILSPMRTTVTTSGMGTPSLEIIANELAALNEIDFESRTRKPNYQRLHVIRLGSSGGLQASTQLGTPVITTYAIGLDNTGLFYEVPYPDETCKRLEKEITQVVNRAVNDGSRFYGKIQPYVSRAEPTLVSALVEASESLGVAVKTGLTVSAPGFFDPQGRDVSRIQSSLPELDQVFTEYDPRLDGQRVENLEMETSFLLHFFGGLGYWAGSICPAIANRQQNTFATQYEEAMLNAGRTALLALAKLRDRHTD